jgi:pantetheine-phosphate adenylyltransferase
MSKNIKTAYYVGSFDPLTNGHIWMINEALKIFDHLYIGVGSNSNKNHMFSDGDRKEMIENYLSSENLSCLTTVVIQDKNEFSVNAAKKLNCSFMIRGIRNCKDFEYEMEIKAFNDQINSDIQTIFLSPPPNIANISSSLIRGCIHIVGWRKVVKQFTTLDVVKRIGNYNNNIFNKTKK